MESHLLLCHLHAIHGKSLERFVSLEHILMWWHIRHQQILSWFETLKECYLPDHLVGSTALFPTVVCKSVTTLYLAWRQLIKNICTYCLECIWQGKCNYRGGVWNGLYDIVTHTDKVYHCRVSLWWKLVIQYKAFTKQKKALHSNRPNIPYILSLPTDFYHSCFVWAPS